LGEVRTVRKGRRDRGVKRLGRRRRGGGGESRGGTSGEKK